MSTKNKKGAWLLIPLVWVLFFNQALLFKGVYFFYDHMMHNYPNRFFFFEGFKQNTLPLWSPTMFGGFPLLAEGQHTFFYPPSFILFNLLPFPYAYNLNINLHFLLAGISCYLFVRLITPDNKPGAVIGGIIYMLSGYLVVHHMHVNIVQAVSYFPLLLYLSEKILIERRSRELTFFSIACGFLTLGGHPQMVISVLFFVLVYFIYRLMKNQDQRNRFKILVVYLFFLGLGLALASIQLLPLFELISFGARAKTDYQFLTFGSLPWKNLITFVWPNFFGSPATNNYQNINGMDFYLELCIYSGIIPFLLFFWPTKEKNEQGLIRFFTILFIFSVLLMLGRNTPFYRLISYLPPFNLTRIPARFGFISSFSLAMLTAFKWPLLSKKINNKPFEFFIVFLIVADLFYFGYSFNPLADPKIYKPSGPITSFLQADESLFRVLRYQTRQISDANDATMRTDPYTQGWSIKNLDYSLSSESLVPDTFTSSGIQTLDGFNQLQSTRLKKLLGAVNSQSSLSGYNMTYPLYNLFNVKYLVSSKRLEAPHLKLVKEWADLKVYRNMKVLPRAMLIADYQVSDPDSILKAMRKSAFNPLSRVYLEEEPPRLDSKPAVVPPLVKITDYQNNQIALTVYSPLDAFLLLSDTYYPGWRAYLNDKQVKLYQADYVLRAIQIPAGQHKVKFVYHPDSYYLGMKISIAALFLLALASFVTPRL